MSVIARELQRLETQAVSTTEKRPVILRFLGTSRGTVSALEVVRSVCKQILLLLGDVSGARAVPSTYKEAVKFMHELIKAHPVLLLFDSLDQLSNADLGRSNISFLDGVVPHPQTRIIVSTLPDQKNASGQWIYCYGCETKLVSDSVPVITVNHLSSAVAESSRIISSLLRRKGMNLTADQMSYAVTQTSVEATALYVRLACREIEKWRSSDDVNGVLPATVVSLIDKIFVDLEDRFGSILVRSALGFLTFSVGGVSDREMEDLLSLDDEVLESVFQYSDPGVKRCPSHVWLRLRAALEGLLVERAGGCLTWYHRQLKEAAERRYDHIRLKLHRVMGVYFGNIDAPVGTRAERRIAAQPLWYGEVVVWFDDCRLNIRRCVEALSHIIACGMLDAAAKELCDFSSICSHIKSGEGFNLVDHSAKVLELSRKTQNFTSGLYDRLSHYARWMRQDMSYIVDSPAMLMSSSIGKQPLISFVRKEWEVLIKSTRSIGPLRRYIVLSILLMHITETFTILRYLILSEYTQTSILTRLLDSLYIDRRERKLRIANQHSPGSFLV